MLYRSTIAALVLTICSSALADSSRAVLLKVAPSEVVLKSARQQQHLLVSQIVSDQTVADLTREATLLSADLGVAKVSGNRVIPVGNGSTVVVVKAKGATVEIPVTVSGFDQPSPIDFRTEVIGALSRGGCNQGACHGSPKGKNGFRMSLRGFDPDVDYQQLTRDIFGRRVNSGSPADSLLLLKASGGVAHQGGVRFKRDETAFQIIRQWIHEGCQDATPKQLTRLEIWPRERRLPTDFRDQQIIVRAHYSDGTVADVTHLASFSSADDALASVSRNGLVSFHETADVAILVRFLDRIETVELTWIDEDEDFRPAQPTENNYIDKHVFAKQRSLQLIPADVASDGVFLRRVFLDLIGALPTPDEALAFLDSKDQQKRSKLIDQLLERDEYAEFWAMKWADVMRGNRETISERGVHNFQRFLVRMLRDDVPFNEVARRIVTALGNTIHEPAANFFRVSRTPDTAAESFSQLFLGVRIQCAKCHNHPYESITQNDYYGLSAYFSRVTIKGTKFGIDDETVLLKRTGEVQFPGTKTDVAPAAFGIAAGRLEPGQDRRENLADWLTSANNPYFARSVMNRVWFHLLGQGIVDPVDDFRDSNLPSNPALLNAIADEFVRSGYRFKPVIRSILRSRTYQLSANNKYQQSPKSANPNRYFTKAVVRMLNAEQILDAISSATGIPESFPGYPIGTRAVSLAEGNIDHRFLKAFTKPIRDVACECARETDPSMSQVLHLMNNSGLLDKLDSKHSRLGLWMKENKTTPEIVNLIYLGTLSRRPTESERKLAMKYIESNGDDHDSLKDLQHALIMSNEFLLRH